MKPQIIFDFHNTLYDPQTKKLFRGTRAMLYQLKQGYRLTLITTKSPSRASQIARSGLKPYFSKVVICSQKSTRIFQELSKNTGDTIVVGDNLAEELIIAQSLNLPAIRVNSQLENPIQTISNKLLKKGNL